MNKVNPSTVLYYIAILSSFILIILVIILVMNNTKSGKNASLEHFYNSPTATPTATPTETPTATPCINKNKQIIHNSNFYNINETIKLDSLGASNICVYNNTDMECITGEELATHLNLPPVRKTKVCLDEECIGEDEIKVLNDTHPIKIKKDNGEYVKFIDVTAQTCNGVGFNINTLGLDDVIGEEFNLIPAYSLYGVNKKLDKSKHFDYDGEGPGKINPRH